MVGSKYEPWHEPPNEMLLDVCILQKKKPPIIWFWLDCIYIWFQIISGSTNFVLETVMMSDRFPQFWFPDGARLYLEVTILDKGTGRREKITDKSIIFSNSPYKLSTAKSQKYFKPGLLYQLKVSIPIISCLKYTFI